MIPERPIRVVVFGGGPVLERGVGQFLCLLEDHPEIELVSAFCQSKGQTRRAVLQDLWRRRGFLALPVLVFRWLVVAMRWARRPQFEAQSRRKLARLSSRIRFVPDIHANEVLEQVRALAPDLGLIYGSPILKPQLFEIPRLGTLGIHHGKVPDYRGKKTTFWALYNGEETAGVTIQKVNAGLDTGDVVKAGEVAAAGRSYRRVWNELEQLGLALYVQAIVEIKRGEAVFRPQRGRRGRLYRDPGAGDLVRFWWRTRVIRARSGNRASRRLASS